MNRKYRSVLCQLRIGILPIEIEVGRWKFLDPDQRLCKCCEMQAIEDESHFIFECPMFNTERNTFVDKLRCEHFYQLDNVNRWKIVMSNENVVETAKFVWSIFEKRKSCLYI